MKQKEIKFRAWYKEKKQMFYNVQDSSHSLGDEDYAKDGEYLGEYHGFNIVLIDEKLIIMQYTGLKDKNGKEIYEGDILFRKYYYNSEMSWRQFQYKETIKVKIPDFFLYLGSDMVKNSPESIKEYVANMEIIGNIYETRQ